MTGCSISGDNDTLIYETPNPYQDNAECEAWFSCPKGYALKYEFVIFEIERGWQCYYDYLGILFIHNLSQVKLFDSNKLIL